ncbi:Frataxin [Coprinopsis marcescibilis]|uniref:ferroxidase n=1 Tax=Coprinopsis marcescibilis TaxID=230819 RepID=A0A5C3KR89_COPMA|nr:Frataxin [Coprinopsis marcescibilis]
MRPGVVRPVARALQSSLFNAIRTNGHRSVTRSHWFNSRHQCPIASRHIRCYATPAPHINESHLSMEEYHRLSDFTMDSMLERLESILDDIGSPNYEVEYHSGVLTLNLGAHGTYVINKQPPNKQIWLSSPFSGPARYDYSEELDDWIYLRDGRSLGDLLNTELGEALEQKVDLDLKGVASKLE